MATTETTPEVTTIDHLDFDIPCNLSAIDHEAQTKSPCRQPAEWFVVSAHHCVPDTTSQQLMCQTHTDELNAGAEFTCGICHERFAVLPRLIRTERIR